MYDLKELGSEWPTGRAMTGADGRLLHRFREKWRAPKTVEYRWAGTQRTALESRGSMSPTTVAEVLARMRDIAAHLPASDGAAVFNSVYLKVTERIQERL